MTSSSSPSSPAKQTGLTKKNMLYSSLMNKHSPFNTAKHGSTFENLASSAEKIRDFAFVKTASTKEEPRIAVHTGSFESINNLSPSEYTASDQNFYPSTFNSKLEEAMNKTCLARNMQEKKVKDLLQKST